MRTWLKAFPAALLCLLVACGGGGGGGGSPAPLAFAMARPCQCNLCRQAIHQCCNGRLRHHHI